MSLSVAGDEGAGRGPAGIYVGEIQGVELRPEDVALGAEGVVGVVLFVARAGVFDDPGEREVGVFGGLRQAAGEIVEAAGEPWVVLAQAIDAQRDQFFRKQFGERRGDGFGVRFRGDEIDVGLDGVARGGEDAVAIESLFAREASGFDEPQPLFDAAGFRAVAIVIDDAFAPGQAEGGIFAAREDGGVFDGDAALVVVAIQSPGLELAARELAFVHQQVEWMFVVIALFADGVKAGDEVGFGERRFFQDRFGGHKIPETNFLRG